MWVLRVRVVRVRVLGVRVMTVWVVSVRVVRVSVRMSHILSGKATKEHSLAKDFSQFVSYLVLYEDVGYPQKIRHLGTKCCTECT